MSEGLKIVRQEKGEFFVWTKSGRPPRFAHPTQEAAEKEAERLAKLNPGKKFIVMGCLCKISAVPE
jgi:hypothetical protein